MCFLYCIIYACLIATITSLLPSFLDVQKELLMLNWIYFTRPINRKTSPKRLIYTIGGERGNKMTLLMGKLTRLPQVKAGGKAIERLQQKSRKSACPPYQRG
jgi:hypothetical protein